MYTLGSGWGKNNIFWNFLNSIESESGVGIDTDNAPPNVPLEGSGCCIQKVGGPQNFETLGEYVAHPLLPSSG